MKPNWQFDIKQTTQYYLLFFSFYITINLTRKYLSRNFYKKGVVMKKWLFVALALILMPVAVLFAGCSDNLKHTISFDSNGGTSVSPITNINHLSLVDKPEDPVRSGYVFDGWYSNGELFSFNGSLVSKDITLTAKWNPLFSYIIDKDGFVEITGLTIHSQNLESICFSSKIDEMIVKKVAITITSNYLKEITFENGIEEIEVDLKICQNLNKIQLPDTCQSMGGSLLSLSPKFLTKYENGLYLGSESNPYFYLSNITNFDEKEFEIHPDCEIVYLQFYKYSKFNTIKSNGTMNQFKNKQHYITQSKDDYGRVYEIKCSDGTFLSYDKYINAIDITGDSYKYKPRLQGCTNICSITIPNNITEIPDDAFAGCRNLTNVVFSDNLKIVGNGAFSGTNLQSIIFPEGVESIGCEALSGCRKLQSIILPKSVNFLGRGIIKGCDSLQSLTTPFVGEKQFDINGFEFMIDDYSNSRHILKELNIINSICVCDFDLHNRWGVEIVNLSEDVKIISGGVFGNCKVLKRCSISNGTISIGKMAFSGCYNLSNINIPSSVTNIESDAFKGCTSLTTIIIPNSVTSIGSFAFSGCKKVFCEQGAELLDWDADWSSGVESVYWYRETKPTEEGNFWHYVDGEPVIW